MTPRALNFIIRSSACSLAALRLKKCCLMIVGASVLLPISRPRRHSSASCRWAAGLRYRPSSAIILRSLTCSPQRQECFTVGLVRATRSLRLLLSSAWVTRLPPPLWILSAPPLLSRWGLPNGRARPRSCILFDACALLLLALIFSFLWVVLCAF